MFEVNVNIHCPDLALAADKLAMAINHRAGSVEAAAAVLRSEVPAAPAPAPQPVAPSVPAAPAVAPIQMPPAAQTAPVHTMTPTAPVNSTPAMPSAPTARYATVPTVPTSPSRPTTTAPTYTHEQVGRAGADLVAANPAMMPTLMDLLHRYGVQLVTDLKPDQLGPFALELRGLGARI